MEIERVENIIRCLTLLIWLANVGERVGTTEDFQGYQLS